MMLGALSGFRPQHPTVPPSSARLVVLSRVCFSIISSNVHNPFVMVFVLLGVSPCPHMYHIPALPCAEPHRHAVYSHSPDHCGFVVVSLFWSRSCTI